MLFQDLCFCTKMSLTSKFFLLRRAASRLAVTKTSSRGYFFLPASFHLDEAWQKRHLSPLMQQIRVEEFYVELKKRFDAEKLGSPLDIEIFANKVSSSDNLPQLEELLEYLRKSSNTVATTPGTYHSVVRLYLELERYDELFKLLADKARYGLFLEPYSGNLLMDKLLERKNLAGAVKIAIEFMLQEEFDNPLTRLLALHSCIGFIQNPDWASVAPPPEPAPPADTGEEILVYVPYLKNPFFDDHFDLKDPKHLVGKTLCAAGRYQNDLLGRSTQIIGLGLYAKWQEGFNLLQRFAETNGGVLESAFRSFVDAFKGKSEAASVTDKIKEPDLTASQLEELEHILRGKGLLKDGNIIQMSEEKVKEEVAKSGQGMAAAQEQLYQKWVTDREDEVNGQIRRYELQERLRQLELKRRQLKAEEDLLFFFERKNDWERMLSPEIRQEMLEKQRLDGSAYDYRVQDPRYEIQQIKDPETYTPITRWRKSQDVYDAKLASQLAK